MSPRTVDDVRVCECGEAFTDEPWVEHCNACPNCSGCFNHCPCGWCEVCSDIGDPSEQDSDGCPRCAYRGTIEGPTSTSQAVL